jgi:glycosyltransferase involved in cell wall biosynthesis
VSLITLEAAGSDFFSLHPAVRRVGLDAAGHSRHPLEAAAGNLRRVRLLRRALRRAAPRAVISFMDRTNVLTLLAARGLGLPVVVSERTNPWRQPPGRPWALLRRLTYRRAAAAVAVSAEAARFLAALAPGLPVEVIANPVAPAPEGCGAAGREPLVVGLGRLAPEKGFDLLLEAFAACAREHPRWRLAILGEGPERPALERRARELGLEGRVELPGRQERPQQWLCRAGAFVLSSRYEGFPNVLAEALACGAPAVAADCSSAVGELLAGGRAGLLVPAGEAGPLARALGRLMADPALAAELGRRGREETARYAAGAVAARWERLLARCGAGR